MAADDDDKAVTQADLDALAEGLEKRLGGALADALEDLRDSITKRPDDQAPAKELTVKDHARALGISVEQVEALREENELGRLEKLLAKREERAAAATASNGDDPPPSDDEEEPQRDGLGGLRNLLR